jgi:glycosyltransferase involved in cell wall biosynthesis
MRVLQINSVCGIGSTGRIATDIHNILIEKGHESYIAYGRDLPKNCDNAMKIGNEVDNYTHVAKTRLFDKHGFGSKQATIEFIDKVKELDPDIIHLHNIHGYYMNVEILFNYLKEANKPVVWTLHDCWSFTGHCAYFDYVGCDKWKTGCYSCPEKKSYPSSLIFDNSKDNYTKKKEIFTGIKNLTLVTPSQWLANLVQESFLNKYPVKVINNGIDLRTFRPQKDDFKKKYELDDKFIILGVASVWDRRKGLIDFIRLSQIIDSDSIIVLVGLTNSQIKKLPNNIYGITKTNDIQELVSIYSSADVFFNPTYEDNYPTTNLEALACETPVITYNTGGSSECITSSNGFILNKGNYIGVIELINYLKDNKIEKINNTTVKDKRRSTEEYTQLYKAVSK